MEDVHYTLSSYEPIYAFSPEIEIPEETIRGEMIDSLRRHHCKDGEEPRLTDAWISAHTDDFETVEQYRIVVRYHLYREVQRFQRFQDEDAVCAELASRLEQDIPQEIIDEARYASQMRFDQFLRENAISKAQYCEQQDMTEEELNEKILNDAVQSYKEDVALAAWAEHYGLKIEGDDIYRCIPGDSMEEKLRVRQQVEQNGGMAGLEDYALKVKAMDQIMQGAYVKRKEYGEFLRFSEVNSEVADAIRNNPDIYLKY